MCVRVFVQVEEGGKADSLEQPLLVGDEIIIINEVELTGFRQEAVALVKGSYKTLQLTVRRYRRRARARVCVFIPYHVLYLSVRIDLSFIL